MNDHGARAAGMAQAFMDGAVSVPYALLKTYRSLRLGDTEAMLLLQLIAFRQMEQNEFPTIEQLQERLGCSSSVVGQTLQKLMKAGYVEIDEVFDPASGVQSEKYNLSGVYRQVAELLVAGDAAPRAGTSAAAPLAEEPDGRPTATPAIQAPAGATPGGSLFALFEQEFGRLLTPTEYEIMNAWLDEDRYPEELIRFALKESVFAGKRHFNYIDRILLEWSRNRVTSVDEARSHTQKFRSGR